MNLALQQGNFNIKSDRRLVRLMRQVMKGKWTAFSLVEQWPPSAESPGPISFPKSGSCGTRSGPPDQSRQYSAHETPAIEKRNIFILDFKTLNSSRRMQINRTNVKCSF